MDLSRVCIWNVKFDTSIAYRDIKGANLLVDAYGVVKLADFGMAKHVSSKSANHYNCNGELRITKSIHDRVFMKAVFTIIYWFL